MMKPILFNTEMVQAVMAGRKTQTRRPIKGEYQEELRGKSVTFVDSVSQRRMPYIDGVPAKRGWAVFGDSPKGYINESWWVRESFCDKYLEGGRPVYRADWPGYAKGPPTEPKWRASLHMPQKYYRTLLHVMDLRVEQVQSITPPDIRAEGSPVTDAELIVDADADRVWFSELWDKIYRDKGRGWDSNPWVWVYKFAIVESVKGGIDL